MAAIKVPFWREDHYSLRKTYHFKKAISKQVCLAQQEDTLSSAAPNCVYKDSSIARMLFLSRAFLHILFKKDLLVLPVVMSYVKK